MSNQIDIATSWGAQMILDLQQNYIKKGLKASGAFGNSLEQKVEQKESSLNIKILGAAQIGMMTFGRGKNQNQDKEKIRRFVGWAGSTFLAEWVKNKGLNISPFAVAWKIAAEGVKVPNQHNDGKLLEETFTIEKVNELLNEVGMVSIENLKSKYIKSWQ